MAQKVIPLHACTHTHTHTHTHVWLGLGRHVGVAQLVFRERLTRPGSSQGSWSRCWGHPGTWLSSCRVWISAPAASLTGARNRTKASSRLLLLPSLLRPSQEQSLMRCWLARESGRLDSQTPGPGIPAREQGQALSRVVTGRSSAQDAGPRLPGWLLHHNKCGNI